MTAAARSYDVIIVGAGAAGLMCAMTAGQRGRRVLLLEHTDKAGAKILISGGGRCNFTNLDTVPARFVSGNPHFCTSALKRYTQHDFIALVQRHAIAFHEKTLGQLFCDGSARAIVGMLLAECAAAGVDLRVGESVTNIGKPDSFRVETASGTYAASALVLATGGLSIPKMGATGFSYDMARQFGLRVTETLPGLVPLKAPPDTDGFDPSLAGVSLEAAVTFEKQSFRENILFTHRGLSGPAILQISSYWKRGQPITLDLLPDIDAAAFLIENKLRRPKASAQTVLSQVFPARLAQVLAAAHLPMAELANVPDRLLIDAARKLKHWQFSASDSEGYAKAEVTVGGIDTRDLSSKTMEANAVPALYAIGEAVDVTGWLGGYNFQWAWSSGWVAGMAV
jgi:predicted Rossmann fold flavoprotein